MKIKKYIYPVANAVIRGLLILIIWNMCLQSMFSTSFIGMLTSEDGSAQERTLNIPDQPWKHLLVFGLFTVVGIFLYRRWEQWRKRRRGSAVLARTDRTDKILYFLSLFTLVMGILWVLATQLAPGSDPAKVYRIAMQWRQGNFSSFAEGGYLFRYPFQAGIILFYYLLTYLFGVENYVGLQFVNVIALVVIYWLLAKLSAFFWKKDKKLPIIVYVALILWVPLMFYVTYLYGILPGMALSLGAVYCAAKYLETRKYRYILPAALCMGLAAVIKMNCLIYLVAVVCFLLYDVVDALLTSAKNLRKRWIGSLVLAMLMALSVIGCDRAYKGYVERLSGYELGEGEVMVSWIVMGLQETPLGPGGYSGYIGDVFVRYEYDTEKIKEASIKDIKSLLHGMLDDPMNVGIPFFARKNAFQWNDPTFIALDRTKGRKSAVDMPEYASGVIDGKGSVTLSVLLNLAQTLLLLGALLYLLLNWKSENIYELMGAVIFLGGYLFHFFWESSASYTIPYFVILIPYAVKGLTDWIRYADRLPATVRAALQDSEKKAKGHAGDTRKQLYVPAAAVLAVAVLTALFSFTELFHNTVALNDGEEAVAQFYHRGEEETAAKLEDGYYYLSPCQAQDAAVTVTDGELTVVSLNETSSDQKEQARVLVNREDGARRIRFRSNEQVLAIDKSAEMPQLTVYMDDSMNMFYQQRSDISYGWKIKSADQGGYYITIDDLALTYRDGELTLEMLSESDEQRWVLQAD